MYKMNAMCLKYFEIFIPEFGNRLTIWSWFGVILIFLFLFFCCYFLLYYFFFNNFNFFPFLFLFFSLQELLCALRVKSRLRHGGWLVGWLVCFLRPFQTFTDFLSTLCWKKCQGPSRNSKHLLYWVNITALRNLITLSKWSIKNSTPKVSKWLLLTCLKSLEKTFTFSQLLQLLSGYFDISRGNDGGVTRG